MQLEHATRARLSSCKYHDIYSVYYNCMCYMCSLSDLFPTIASVVLLYPMMLAVYNRTFVHNMCSSTVQCKPVDEV
jgi:hypothetical protein